MTYRPTVRYDDVYSKYVEELFHATNLDRSQIIRLGLFLLGHTEEGTKILEDHKKRDVQLPSPLWEDDEHGLWKKKSHEIKGEGRTSKPSREERRPKRVISNNTGGIKIYVK